MILEDRMPLYHGSYTEIQVISLEKCSRGKDFGRGFYLTSDINQAQNFIKTSLRKAKAMGIVLEEQNFGYVSTFLYKAPDNGIKTYFFDDANREWLWYIAQNRRSHLAEILKDKIDTNISKSDIIIGKIANDTTNPVITAYLNGLYGDILSDTAIDFAIKQLMPDHLVDQYCFLTQPSIDCLEFQEANKYVL